MAVVTTQLDHDARLFSVVSRLLRESGWRHARGYAVAMALAAVVAGTTGAILFLVRDVVDDILVDKNKAALLLLSGAVMATFLVRGLAMFGYSTILAQIGNAIILEQQQRMFRKILSCEPSALSGSSSGEILNVIGAGANGARQLLNALATAIGRDALNLIVLLGSMIWLDPWLTLGMLAGAPLIAVLISTITKRLRAQVREHMQVTGKLNDRIRSGVQGLRTIKAFGMEERFGDAMGESAERLRKVGNKVVITGQRIAPFMEIIAGFAIGAGIAIVGWGAINEGRTPGELVAFLVAALLAYDPARRLVQARTSIEQGLVAVRTMFTFIDDEGPLVDPPGAKPMRIAAGEVRFEAVSFAYEPEHPVLRDVSFTAPAGEVTALVGRSGGGKTTVINLLLRFWRADQGRVLVDGQDVAEGQVASLRANVAYVGQDAFLFDGSVRENLMAGAPAADEARMIAAARDAGAHDFISALPGGYDSPVGELGANLSGGQRQRVAIARALLRDAPIVVLDEPTSALDAETEREIQSSLRRLAEGRTTLVVAHRLSTIRDADQIIVLDDGRVAESGAHDALIARRGVYFGLYGDEDGGEARERSETAPA